MGKFNDISKTNKMLIINHSIELVKAKPMDLMELDYMRQTNTGYQKVFKLKEGIPFFLKDSKGNIEDHHYITTDATNLEELGSMFKQNRVLIIKPI